MGEVERHSHEMPLQTVAWIGLWDTDFNHGDLTSSTVENHRLDLAPRGRTDDGRPVSTADGLRPCRLSRGIDDVHLVGIHETDMNDHPHSFGIQAFEGGKRDCGSVVGEDFVRNAWTTLNFGWKRGATTAGGHRLTDDWPTE